MCNLNTSRYYSKKIEYFSTFLSPYTNIFINNTHCIFMCICIKISRSCVKLCILFRYSLLFTYYIILFTSYHQKVLNFVFFYKNTKN